jgi:AcrR family transcriptional regulator
MDAIITAAIRLIEHEGIARLNTTRIAEVAGVSVGSLYQYFPNREAIIGEIIDQQLDAMLRAFRALAGATAELPLEHAVDGVLRGLLEASRAHEKLHAPLYEEMGAAARSERYARTLDAYVEILAAWLAARDDLALDDPRAAAALIVHAADGVIRLLVVAPAAAPMVIAEGVRVVTSYLNAKTVAVTSR